MSGYNNWLSAVSVLEKKKSINKTPCAICKKFGHNKKTCKQLLSDQNKEKESVQVNVLEKLYRNKIKMFQISPMFSILLL